MNHTNGAICQKTYYGFFLMIFLMIFWLFWTESDTDIIKAPAVLVSEY